MAVGSPTEVSSAPKKGARMLKVRQQSYASARLGQGEPLQVEAAKGDLLVLVLASQWATVGDKTVPAGWKHVYADGHATAGRSGFIAWTRAQQDTTVRLDHWWGETDTYAARQRGLLLAVSGAGTDPDPAQVGWTPARPDQVGPGLVLAQEHGSRWDPLNAFTVSGGQVLLEGEASSSASWSTLRAVLANQAGTVSEGTRRATVVWATIPLKPAAKPPVVKAPAAVDFDLAVARADGTVTAAVPTPLRSWSAATVDALLSRKRWMIAHRGGSADWPEMSLKAYAESARRAVPALEFSFSATKDDALIGLHDQTLKRVDASAPDTPVTQMTWKEASRYRTQGQPFIRLETLLSAFGSDHVLFLDPKYSAHRHDLYLRDLDPRRTILKYYGDATWLAKIWRAKGFKCWGFMYPPEILDGRGAAWAPYWDLVGVPWWAEEEVWDTAKSYGKPLIGHICPNQQAIDRCFEMGATGVMCAKIDGMVLR